MFHKLFSLLIALFIVSVSLLHGQTMPVPAADHHIHIRSEAGSEAFVKILKKLEDRDISELPPLPPE